MRDLRVGDMVLADGAIFEPVYFFGHADGAATRAYVMLHLQKHNKTVRGGYVCSVYVYTHSGPGPGGPGPG